MIKAVIFDMDGLLIDSEALWQEVETEVFNSVGVPLTAEMTAQTMGLRSDEVVKHWYKQFPWEGESEADINQRLVERVIEVISERGQELPGVRHVISLVHAANIPMALASSSQTMIINAVLDRIGIREYLEVVHSAENEPYGKPHPAVYLTAASKLGIDPADCLAFEDSVNGVISAKAAKMKCVAVPAAEQRNDPRFGVADLILGSLVEFKPSILSELGA